MSNTNSLSPEDEKLLQTELPEVLEKSGVNNKSKAQYVKMISDEVLGSTNPNFFSMQPKIKNHSDSEAWNAAYYIVLNILKDNQINYTLETVNNEMKLKKVENPPPQPHIPSGVEITEIEEYFNMDIVMETAVTDVFSEKVENFLNEHPELAPHTLAEPLSTSTGAFLTEPNPHHVDDANEDQQSQQSEDEKIDINNFTDDEEKDEHKEAQKSDDDYDLDFVEDFNDDEDEDKQNKPNEEHSDAFNSMSLNSENFEIDLGDD